MKIAGIIKESIVDGPGVRLTIFFQGCLHHCLACHNKETWPLEGGDNYATEELVNLINKSNHIDGITISGGDPYFQYVEFLDLLKEIKSKCSNKLDIIVYTGFTYEEVYSKFRESLNYIDYLIDGKFVLSKRSLQLYFRGSTNQRFIDVKNSLIDNIVVSLSDDEIDKI